MNIQVVEERDNDVLVLLPVDRIDSSNAAGFESIITNHISNGELRLIFDFSRLNFISSSWPESASDRSQEAQRNPGEARPVRHAGAHPGSVHDQRIR